MEIEWKATIEDLKHSTYEGQVELVNGTMIELPFHVEGIADAVLNIAHSLRQYEKRNPTTIGRAFTSTIAYVVDLPHRKSFSPDVSFAITRPKNPMDFIPGAPIFAAEVRAPDELTAEADEAFARKRTDYFAAGTLVVWDVDPWHLTIAAYTAARPAEPIMYRPGMIADAEPALPGWQIAVDDVFEDF
jgi:Uma2 family endonuclease